MSVLDFIKKKKQKDMREEIKNTLETQESGNEITENVSSMEVTDLTPQEETEEREDVSPEKTLIVIQWDGLNRATSEFEFLDNFKGATVWIFSKKPIENLPEKFNDFNVKLFPMPEYEKSLQNFLLTTTLLSLFVDNPGQFEKVVFVSAHQYFEGSAYVLSQRGISSEAIVYLLPEKTSKGTTRPRYTISRHRYTSRRPVRRKPIRRRTITFKDAERIREDMLRKFKTGQIYSVRDISQLVSKATNKRFIDLFGVSSIGPFIRMLKDNSCIEEVSPKEFKFIDAPTIRMILNSPKYRRRSSSVSSQPREVQMYKKEMPAQQQQETNETELDVTKEISNLGEN